jgi:hypothetical protein
VSCQDRAVITDDLALWKTATAPTFNLPTFLFFSRTFDNETKNVWFSDQFKNLISEIAEKGILIYFLYMLVLGEHSANICSAACEYCTVYVDCSLFYEYLLCCVWIPLLVIHSCMRTQWLSVLLCMNTCWVFTPVWILSEYPLYVCVPALLCVWITADLFTMNEYSVNIRSDVCDYLLIYSLCMNTRWISAVGGIFPPPPRIQV